MHNLAKLYATNSHYLGYISQIGKVLEVLIMSKVMVVTDSTANLSPQLMDGNPVRVLPLQLIWDHKIMRDSIDISANDFYTRLEKSSTMPTTSQTTPEEFKQCYAELIEKGYEILSVHISSKLSGTLDSAIQAKRAFLSAKIELVDSLSTSMAMGFQVMAAARLAANGGSLQECKVVAEKAREHTGVYFAVNTLEYLKRGGRIGGAAAFLGTALQLKPLLELREGQIEAVERVRTLSKTLDRLLDLVEARIANSQGPIRLCAIHGNSLPEAEQLLDKAVARFSSTLVSEALISDISPVIGTHAGPGALGVAWMEGM
jgi:DegV family protein with EDD domain